jgi:SWI/SNF-related matrix-associated actin-dependent regulator 1 of chromatin subfamily A
MNLLPYQVAGVEFASAQFAKGKHSLIADEMGLGKTVQAIGVINSNPEISRVLIVCPTSLILNWWSEMKVWLTRDIGVSVVSYDSLHKVNTLALDLVIFDEAHYIKNPKTDRCTESKRVASKAKRVLLLTGTPIENRPLELWPLLQILDAKTWDPPGTIKRDGKRVKVGAGEGANFFSFAKRYCNAHRVQRGRKTFWDFNGATNLGELNEWLKKTGMIRRLKRDVLTELPD